MKRLLPILFTTVLFLSGVFSFPGTASAQVVGTTPVPDVLADWREDQEVTFIGKTAARANAFLEWTLQNYEWIDLGEDAATNPLAVFWSEILRIVLALIVLFILVAAFIMIITRGQNLTIVRFIPRFIIILLFIVLSFAIVRFLYQFFDVIQGFFLATTDPESQNERLIDPTDLLYIGFDYQFMGYRKAGIQYDESAYISLLLVRITAVTYYVMSGILLIRKIILWFFLIISPVFPLLIFFSPLRNTAKVWVGEFFRWLLYAPLFAIFLHGLVGMWRDRIPLGFDFSGVEQGQVVYPTAISILLGGPAQRIGITNSVNLSDTFAQYVVALLMLWVVILLPWLLLQIFLDYINNASFTETALYRRIARTNIPFINQPAGSPPGSPPPPPPISPAGAGRAMSLPFSNKRQMQIPVKKITSADVNKGVSSQQRTSAVTNETTEVMRLANLSIPKMRDIARMESASLTKNQTIQQQRTEVTNKLSQISSPATAPVIEREKFTTIKEKLVQMQQKGDPLASSILSASRLGSQVGMRGRMAGEMVKNRLNLTLQHIASPTRALSPQERQKAQSIREELLSAQSQGNPLATYVLDMSNKVASETINEEERQSLLDKVKEKLFAEKEKGSQLAEKVLPQEGVSAIAQASLPVVNRVQQVSLDEYEEVKNIWKENYANMEPPAPLDGKRLSKEEWVTQDGQKIEEAINLLSSPDQTQIQKGMETVSDVLPFLLIGGFSKAEVIAYLKAKQAAGREVLEALTQKREEDDMLLKNKPRQESASAEMVMRRELPIEQNKDNNSGEQDA